MPVYAEMKERDKDLYEQLETAGFMLDFGEDGSGLLKLRAAGDYLRLLITVSLPCHLIVFVI